ncbi:MAG: DUF3419 family protein [Alphaproteobacteria bacterium]
MDEFDPQASLCLFRIPKKGGRVIWEVTNTCNYGCRYCIFSSTSRQHKDELETSQVFSTIDQLRDNGFTHVKITGGEPFSRPDIMDILRRCCDAGLRTDISTNASTIAPEIARELAAMKLEMVHVSLDGHTQFLQETVRGKRTWEPTLEGLKHLIAANLYVRVGCVIYDLNENELSNIAAFCADMGCSEIIFSRMEPVGRMRGREELVSKLLNAELQKRVDTAAAMNAGRIKVSGSFAEVKEGSNCAACPGGERFLFIDHKGRVSPCTWVAERKPEFRAGRTLHDASLTDILRGAENRNFRRMAIDLHAAGLQRCPMQALPDVVEAERTNRLFTGNLEENLKAGGRFSEVSPVYPFATENLGGYFGAIDFKNKKVLSVASSGDHAINAFAAGAAAVTCFDLNFLARHMMELKLAALQVLDLDGFIAFFRDLDADTYKKLALPVASRYFWDRAIGLRSSALFKDNHDARAKADKAKNALLNNPYLQSAEAYRKAQQACKGKRVSFVQSDIVGLVTKLDEKYDVILLSNLSDYAHHMFADDCLKNYNDKIVAPLKACLADGGTMAFGYVYDGMDLHGSKARSPINDAVARRAAFGVYEEIDISSTIDDHNHDTVLLLRA